MIGYIICMIVFSVFLSIKLFIDKKTLPKQKRIFLEHPAVQKAIKVYTDTLIRDIQNASRGADCNNIEKRIGIYVGYNGIYYPEIRYSSPFVKFSDYEMKDLSNVQKKVLSITITEAVAQNIRQVLPISPFDTNPQIKIKKGNYEIGYGYVAEQYSVCYTADNLLYEDQNCKKRKSW